METISSSPIVRAGDASANNVNNNNVGNNNNNYKEIISTLPTVTSKKCASFQLCNYKGQWFTPAGLEVVIPAHQHFVAQPTDIYLCTLPKSGTTWLKALCFAILKRNKFSVGDPSHPLLTKFPHELVPFLEHVNLPFQSGYSRDSECPLLGTHLAYDSLPQSILDSDCKIVYLCRDAKDVLVSNWYFNRKRVGATAEEFPLEEAFELFCEGVSLGGPYWDHVLGYWRASLEFPDKILFLMYEDLKRDVLTQAKRLADFMTCPFTLEEEEQGVVQKIVDLCSFENLSKLETNTSGQFNPTVSMVIEKSSFFRKGKTADWKNNLTVEMAAKIDQITKDKFANYSDLSCSFV